MAKNGGQITFGIKFEADNSGLEKIKKSFQDLRNLTPSDLLKINPSFEGDMNKARKAWKEIRNTVGEVERAVDDAFNTDLGVINVQKLNTSLKNIGIEKISTRFANAGVAGQRAFNEIAKGALTTNVKLKETNSLLDKMGNTLINTIKWNISSSAVNSFTNSIQQAWGYVKHLDSSLNDIRIVTSKSAEEMDKFAEKANKAAKTLGASTTDYTEAALIYYQQGLSDKETAARAETTIKAANVTGQSGEAVSEQLTAVWNGYKVSAEEAELYIDKLAAVAATTASDLEELSTGMSKVASAAAIMGVDIDQLNAQLATIVSVTREAPESIGTALKTVYARMSDIKAGLDGEVSLDEYTQQMEAMGIHVLDANGNLRDMGEVIEEIGGKWQTMTREQQTSLAQTIAGTRQYSRMMALFDNWDMYTKALETSADAAGTLNEQNEIYLESTEAHLKQLTAAKEGLFDSLLEADGINPLIDGLTTIVETLEKVVDAAGGMKGALAGVGSLFTKLFSKQIAQNIEPFISNINSAKRNAEQLQAVLKNTETFAIGKGYSTEAAEAMRQTQIEMSQYWDVMTREEIDESQSIIRQIGDITQLQTEWKEASKAAQEYFSSITTYKISKKGNITENQSTNKLLQEADVSRGLQGLRDDAEGVGGVSKQQQAAAKATLEIYEKQESAIKQMTAAQEKMNEAASQNLTVEKKIAFLLEKKDNLISASKEALQEELKAGLINEEQYNDAINKLEEYFNKIEKAQQKYNKASDDEKKSAKVQDYGIDAKDLKQNISGIFSSSQQGAEDFNKVAGSMRNAAGAAAALGDQQNKLNISVLKTRKTIQNITNALNTFSNVAMGFSAIGSIKETLESPDLSGWEKIAQVMMSLSMTIPMLTSAYSAFNTVMTAGQILKSKILVINGSLIASETAMAVAQKVVEAATISNNEASDFLAETLTEEQYQHLQNTSEITKETAAIIANTLAKKENVEAGNPLKESQDFLEKNIKSAPKSNNFTQIFDIIKEKGLKNAFNDFKADKITPILEKISSAFNKLKGVLSGATGSIGATVAAWASLVAIGGAVIFTLHRIGEANDARDASKEAAKEREKTESLREEKVAIDAIVSSYKDLNEQYKNGEISYDSLRSKVADLCEQYEQQDLKVKALIASERELNQIMEEAKNRSTTELVKQDATQASLDKAAVIKGFKASGTRDDNFGETLDLKGMFVRDFGGEESDFEEDLKELGIEFKNNDHIYIEDLIEAYATNKEALMEVLNKYDIDAAAQIKELIAGNQEDWDSYAATVSEMSNLNLELGLDQEFQKGINSVQEYEQAIRNVATTITNETLGPKTEDNAEAWDEYYNKMLEQAENYYSKKDELQKFWQQKYVAEELGIGSDQTARLTEAQLNYLTLHVDAAKAYDTLDEFLKDYEELIKIGNSKSILLEVTPLLTDSEKTEFSNEELATFFELEDFDKYLGYSYEQIKGINFQDQKILLMGAIQQYQVDLLASYEEALSAQNKNLEKVSQENIPTLEGARSNIIKALDATTWSEEFSGKVDEVAAGVTVDLTGLEAEQVAVLSLIEKYGDLETAKEKVSSMSVDEISDLMTGEEISNAVGTSEGTEGFVDTVGQMAQVQATIAEIENLKNEILALDQAAAESAQSLADLQLYKENGSFASEEGAAIYNERAEELYEASRMEGLDSEEVRDYAHSLMEVSENSDQLSDDLKDNLEDSQDLAVQLKRMNNGVETLAENWDDWSDILKNSSKESEEYADAMKNSKKAMADLLDVTEEFISDDFVTENMEEIAKAAEGDAEAIDNLRGAMLEDIIMHLDLDDSAISREEIFNRMQSLQDMIDINSLKVGAEVDDSSFIEACNALIADAGLTKDQVNAMFSGMGFDVNYAEEPQSSTTSIPTYQTDYVVVSGDPNGPPGSEYSMQTRTYQVGVSAFTGEIPAFAMATSAPGETATPKINSVTKKAGGSMNNASSSNKGGGGKSGGGGGGSKPKEPDKKDPIDDQIDRYHDINVEIQRLSTAYDRLGKAQEKLSGADLIKNLNEQLKVLEKQKDAYAAKIELARQEQAELQNSLGAGGVTFAEDGTISNYAAALQNQENQVNAIIANYNNMTAEEQEAYKEVVEKAQEDYEKFKEEIARYDELVNSEIPEMEDAIQEFIDQQVEIQVQKFNMSVEIELDLAEAERQWNEFKKTVIDGIDEDDILGNAGAALNNLNVYSDPTTGEGTVSATSGHVNDILNELALMDAGQESSIYGTDRAKAIEDLKTYSDTLMEEMMNFEGEVKEIRQMYLDLIDETNEEIDKQIENYEFVTDLIEHDLNLIEKIKGEDAYAEMATYYDKQAENYKSQLEFQRQEVNLWKERMDAAKSAGNEDAYEKFKENWMEAVEQLNSTTDAALDNLMSKYENAVSKIFDDLNNKVTNGMGLDYVAEEWELSNQAAERYLDTVNEAFAIDSLRNKYQTAIDESSSLTTQQKLNDLMKEEIEALEKKDKLTQYDVDRANMKYDIALKQLALEEAQQNKSQMRLRRDSQGNYTYQFVSDEDQMAQAQQELAEAQNSLYNFDKERYQANLDEMLSTYTEFTEKMAEASLIIDDEERLARQAMLREKYGEIINGIVADNETVKLNLQDSAFTELAGIYDVNTENYKNMTQEQKDLVMSDLIPAWQEGAQAMVDAFSGPGGFEETVGSTFDELDLATQDYVNGLDAIGEAAGVNFDDVINGIDDTIDTMDGIIDGNDDIISQYDEQLDQMDDILDKLDDMIEKYKSIKTEAIAASEAAYKYQKEEAERQAAEAAKKAAEEAAKNGGNAGGNSSSSGQNGSSGGSPSNSGGDKNNDTQTPGGQGHGYRVMGGKSGSSYGDFSTRPAAVDYIEGRYGRGKMIQDAQYRTYTVYVNKGKGSEPVSKKEKISDAVYDNLYITQFKTGGYTGEWTGGSEEKNGKLAMLHQKELVLNEQDTSNFLTAIQIIRGMSGVLETMTGRLSSLDGGFSIPTGSMGEITQEIIINAEFPDATDRNEIQAAFENLVGRASQYAFNTEK